MLRANALEELLCLSVRGIDCAPLSILSSYGFTNLKEIDLGENMYSCSTKFDCTPSLERVRLDDGFVDKDEFLKIWSSKPQGDIFHKGRLFFRRA